MTEYPNFLNDAVIKNKDLLKELNEGTVKFYDSLTEVIASKGDRELKAIKDEDNSILYIFEKDKDKINVMVDEIYDFQKDYSIKKILNYPIESIKKGTEIYSMLIISMPKNEKEKPEFSDEDFFKDFEDRLGDEGKEHVRILKEMFKDDLAKDPYFFTDSVRKRNIKTTSDLKYFKNYCEFLNKKNLMSKKDDYFYLGLTEKLNDVLQNNLENTVNDIKYLKEICVKKKFTSQKKSFEFNDLDNHVWIQEGGLVVSDQSCAFYVKEEAKGFTIYFIDKEEKDIDEEVKRINSGKNISLIDDVIFKVEDNKVVYVGSLINVFELDLTFSTIAMEEAGYGEKTASIDMKSYEYQKDYYFTKYGYSELDFLAQAFLTLGGGFDYDKKKGVLYDNQVKVLSKIEKDEDQPKFEQIRYCYPKEISYLNDEWLAGLKLLVNGLKNTDLLPIAFKGDSAKESMTDAINYFEKKIKALEKKNKIKP